MKFTASSMKAFKNCKNFLFFCDHSRVMQENYVMRKNIIEIEQNLIRLAKLPGLPIQQADVVC
jgi:hypothetical protein